MTSVTVVIPTHNRPQLLPETLKSVAQQTLRPDEVIVVDEASDPPIDEQALNGQFDLNIRVARNDAPHGLAWARNQGAELAQGEIVAHLDDDDLFAAETLAEGVALLNNDPELELIFVGVEGFGERAPHFNRVQSEAVAKVLKRSGGVEIEPGVVTFGQNLMNALLYSVPSAFQHVIVRREVWHNVSSLRRQAYCLDPAIADEEEAKARITGSLRDSEWALYAGAKCRKTALLNRPRYLARCNGQGLTSQATQKEKHDNQSILIKKQLLAASHKLNEITPWKRAVEKSLATKYFDTSYYYLLNKKRLKSWQLLFKATRLHPHPTCIKLALKILLPVKT